MSDQDIMCEVEISDTSIVEVVDSDHFRDIDGVSYEHYAVGDPHSHDGHFEEVTCETEDSSPGMMLQQIEDGMIFIFLIFGLF